MGARKEQWQYFRVDLEGYAGRDIVLYFEVYNNGTSGRRTWMYVDDVSVFLPGAWAVSLPIIVC